MTLYNSEGGAVNVSADLVDAYILAGYKPAGVKKTTDTKTEEPEKVETKKTEESEKVETKKTAAKTATKKR